MKILTAQEMRSADRSTTERFGVSSLDLMENAGSAVARFVLREFPDCRRITVLCGKGNNGGDGFVAGRRLADAGRAVAVLLLGNPEDLQGDAKAMYAKLPSPSVIVPDEATLASAEVRSLLVETALFIDAVVGTGFKPPLRGAAAVMAERINALAAPVVAVDLPSGWDSDSREFDVKGAFRADGVVTFTAPKLAHLFGNLTPGGIVVAGIGSPEEAIQSETRLSWTGTAKKVTEAQRNPDSNKGMYGHVLVIGGSRGKAGAPSMSSLAALRAGAGLVTAAAAESSLPTVARVTPELMTTPLLEGSGGEVSSANLEPERLQALLKKIDVVAVGPGLGEAPETTKFVHGLLRQAKQPMVVDADALNIVSKQVEALDGRGRVIVVTPHPGEMARLVGKSIKDVQADREGVARDFAVKHAVTVVLKGWRTLVAHPDGSIAVNTTGNPGLAKGGSGDILTGIVAAMLGQYARDGSAASVARAVEAAVYLHGLAADLAILHQDQHTLLATDVVAHLFAAFRFEPEDKGGYVWLQGVPHANCR